MRKSKSQVLTEFTKRLFEHDPMGLCYPNNPDRESEYDGEAVSILARFVEATLIVGSPEQDAREMAYQIVQNAFEFWFSHPLVDEAKTRELATELLEIFRSSYPEQEATPVVVSET
jgi:hypothetical protein